MIRSMTGFGSASSEVDGAHYVVEVRSLNNKYFKSQVRLPEEIAGLEAQLDRALAGRLTRGTVVLTVRYTDMSADAAAPINVDALQRYLDQLLKIEGLRNGSVQIDVADLLALPGVMTDETSEVRMKKAGEVLAGLLDDACDKLIAMRDREGKTLHSDLHRHCDVVADRLGLIEQRIPELVTAYQARLQQRMEQLLADSGITAREEDMVREVAFFAEKSDISEEIARLQGHLEQFREIIDTDDQEPAGRTLDFLTQEMLREANTIGSKCLDSDVARQIVDIKGGIDRMKEQVQNVE